MSRSVATLDASGHVAFGEQYAGKDVLIEEIETGVWVVKLGQLIPDSERWLHTPEVSDSIDRSLAWIRENPPRETDLEELEERILRGAAAGP
jgi:hypothetical protein